MKKTRKEALIYCFPAVDKELMDKMKGRGAKNYVVFLTRGAELFARCFHRYSTGDLVERQRYVFARDGSVRYGSDNGINWAASVSLSFASAVWDTTMIIPIRY